MERREGSGRTPAGTRLAPVHQYAQNCPACGRQFSGRALRIAGTVYCGQCDWRNPAPAPSFESRVNLSEEISPCP